MSIWYVFVADTLTPVFGLENHNDEAALATLATLYPNKRHVVRADPLTGEIRKIALVHPLQEGWHICRHGGFDSPAIRWYQETKWYASSGATGEGRTYDTYRSIKYIGRNIDGAFGPPGEAQQEE